MAAYNQAMLHAGLPVEKWVARMFWYCADGAEVMQPTGNGIAGLLMKLPEQVLGYRYNLVTVTPFPYAAHVCSKASMESSQPSMGGDVGQDGEDDSDHGEDCHRRRWLLGADHASLAECNVDGSEWPPDF